MDAEWKVAVSNSDHNAVIEKIDSLPQLFEKQRNETLLQYQVIERERNELLQTLSKLESEFKVLSDDLIEARMNLAQGNDWNTM